MIRLSDGERIEKVICWVGLSTNAFAMQIGLSSPQSLYQIKSGKHRISRAIAERICNRYPEVDWSWLLTGEGEMLRPHDRALPYYRAECTEVVLGRVSMSPERFVSVPLCGDCDFVAPYNSRDMEPAIKQGSLLFCRRCEVADVCVGDIVVVATPRAAMVRKVVRVGEAELLLSAEASDSCPVHFDLTLLRTLYVVVAVLEWKNK